MSVGETKVSPTCDGSIVPLLGVLPEALFQLSPTCDGSIVPQLVLPEALFLEAVAGAGRALLDVLDHAGVAAGIDEGRLLISGSCCSIHVGESHAGENNSILR